MKSTENGIGFTDRQIAKSLAVCHSFVYNMEVPQYNKGYYVYSIGKKPSTSDPIHAIGNAGDEFVVMLNTTDEQFVQSLIRHAKRNFEEENEINRKPYQLSASMGYATSDLRVETLDDFMNRINRRMYQDKLAYYKGNEKQTL